MKTSSPPAKSKNGSVPRTGKPRPAQGDLFLGYKALHELRILVRIASSQNHLESKSEKPSY